MNNNEKYLIKSLIKSFTVLELISKKEKMSIKEIDKETDFGKSTVFRILTTLKEMNYIDQDTSDSKYFATMKVVELGKNISNKLPLKDISRPYLEKLFYKTKETVNIGVIVDSNIIYLDKITTKEPLRVELEIGRKVPIYCSALGKSILAFNNSINLNNLQYEKFTSTTITNVNELKKQLNEIRKKGYAFDNEEYIEHLVCIAVPIFNEQKKAIASISIDAPTIRMDKQRKAFFIEELKNSSKQIQEEIKKLYIV